MPLADALSRTGYPVAAASSKDYPNSFVDDFLTAFDADNHAIAGFSDNVSTVVSVTDELENVTLEEEHTYAHDMKKPAAQSSSTPSLKKVKELDRFAATLPSVLQHALQDTTGKQNFAIQVSGELRIRHIFPPLLCSGYLDDSDIDALDVATPLVVIYVNLLRQYGAVDPSAIRGMAMYKGFKQETDFHQERIRLSSAALLQQGCNVESLVRYIGGTHTGAHRNIAEIRRRLTPSVEPELLRRIIEIFEYGAPRAASGYSSDENFHAFRRYGNHKSCTMYADKFKEVMVKDSKRGNMILVDDRLLWFIRDLHLTPQAMVDVDNIWKNARPVFDSSF